MSLTQNQISSLRTLLDAAKRIKSGKQPTKEQFALLARLDGETSEFPVYDSLAQCSAATGVPLGVLKSAKRNGCAAFKSNRVFLKDFLSWYFTQADGDAPDLLKERARRERASAIREERENEIAEGKLCYWEDVLTILNQRTFAPLKSALDSAPKEVDRDWVEKVVRPLLRQHLESPKPK